MNLYDVICRMAIYDHVHPVELLPVVPNTFPTQFHVLFTDLLSPASAR